MKSFMLPHTNFFSLRTGTVIIYTHIVCVYIYSAIGALAIMRYTNLHFTYLLYYCVSSLSCLILYTFNMYLKENYRKFSLVCSWLLEHNRYMTDNHRHNQRQNVTFLL